VCLLLGEFPVYKTYFPFSYSPFCNFRALSTFLYALPSLLTLPLQSPLALTPLSFLISLLPTTLFLTTLFHTHRLQTHLALDGVVATDLGQMVGSLSSDNELWLAMVLTRESVQNLTSGVSTLIHLFVHSWT
jgi:hypothetical protein